MLSKMPGFGYHTFTLYIAILAACVGYTGPLWAEPTAEQKKAISELRTALAARALGEFDAKVTAAKGVKGDAAYEDEVARLELLAGYVKGFWESVDKGAQAALVAGEFNVDGKPIAMVEFERGLLVIRHEGQNKRYTRETLPAKLALVFAQRHLKPEVANNKVYFGAFLATDGKGDRGLAKLEWQAAAKGGADVTALLPELEGVRAAAPVALPELSAAQQAMLHPAQWQRLEKKGNRFEREPLGKQGRQSAEGRLVVEGSGGEETLVAKARLAGDFQCRVFLKDVTEGQRFGLFSGVSGEPPVLVPLPEGTAKVEFARIKGVFTCRINDEDVVLAGVEKSAAKVAGYLGVSLLDGKALTVASFELAAR